MYVAKLMVSYLVKLHLFKNHTPTLPKPYSDFAKSPTPIFTKSLPDLAGWFSQNHTPTLPKSHSDFHKITAWFSQHHWLIFTKSHSDFTKIADWFAQNHWLIFTKTRVDFEAPDCCFTVPLYTVSKIAPSPIVRPACQKVSAVSSRACRVALTVFVLVCEKKNLVLFTGSSCLAFHHFAVLR